MRFVLMLCDLCKEDKKEKKKSTCLIEFNRCSASSCFSNSLKIHGRYFIIKCSSRIIVFASHPMDVNNIV